MEFNGVDHFGTLAAANFPVSASGDLIFAGLIKATNIGGYHNIIDDAASNRPMLWISGSDCELNYRGGTGALRIGTGVDGWDVFIVNSRTNQIWINSVIANATGGGAVPYNLAEAFDPLNRNGGQTFQGPVADLRVCNSADDFGGDYAALNADLSKKTGVPGARSGQSAASFGRGRPDRRPSSPRRTQPLTDK